MKKMTNSQEIGWVILGTTTWTLLILAFPNVVGAITALLVLIAVLGGAIGLISGKVVL